MNHNTEHIENNKESTHIRRPKVTQERPDGSSDGLYEALDIDLWNGYKACSNWEHFDQIGSLEDLFPEIKEQTAEELIAEFLKDNEHLEEKEKNS